VVVKFKTIANSLKEKARRRPRKNHLAFKIDGATASLVSQDLADSLIASLEYTSCSTMGKYDDHDWKELPAEAKEAGEIELALCFFFGFCM